MCSPLRPVASPKRTWQGGVDRKNPVMGVGMKLKVFAFATLAATTFSSAQESQYVGDWQVANRPATEGSAGSICVLVSPVRGDSPRFWLSNPEGNAVFQLVLAERVLPPEIKTIEKATIRIPGREEWIVTGTWNANPSGPAGVATFTLDGRIDNVLQHLSYGREIAVSWTVENAEEVLAVPLTGSAAAIRVYDECLSATSSMQ